MTVLGLSGSVPSGEMAASFKGGWIRHFKLALSSAGGAAVAIAVFSLLERQPAEGFKLLGQWGPWPVLGLVGLLIGSSFLSRINETIGTSFGAVVTSVQQQAAASRVHAEALMKLADQSGEQARETHRLAMFAAQESQNLLERLDQQDDVLNAIKIHLVKGGSGGTTGDGSGA